MDKFEEEMPDMMEKGHQNVVKHYQEQISFLLELEPQKIQSLIDTMNSHGASMSLNKFAEITGLSATMGTASIFRNTLITLIHFFMEHNEDLVRDFNESKFGKEGYDKIKTIFDKFDKKAKDGFGIRFYMNMAEKEYTLASLGSDTVLHQIENEKRETVGYLPLIRARIEIYDYSKNESTVQKIDFDLEECNAFIKGLQNVRDSFVATAKAYKEKLGDTVIVSND